MAGAAQGCATSQTGVMSNEPFSPSGRIKSAKNIRFYLTASQPCPYLPGRRERKVFAALDGPDAVELNDNLTHAGFRRSQNIAYRPACDMCAACVSVRVPVARFRHTRRWRKVLARNADLVAKLVPPQATYEQFGLLKRYLLHRHQGDGMSEMGPFDYAAMAEESAVRTHIIEYRQGGEDGPLMACALVDALADGLSLIYSFFDPEIADRSPGSFIILDHLRQASLVGYDHVYLGYWIRGSEKMSYKSQFRPLEALGPTGWADLEEPETSGA
jgi:arginine-tRNA-protein transferase